MKSEDSQRKKYLWVLMGIILISLLWRLGLQVSGAFPFNGDEAIVALMGRHILQGASPIFFYGQAYMGSLDAYLVALGFLVFGQQVWVIRLVQALLFAGTIGTAYCIGYKLSGERKSGLLAAIFLAIPNVNLLLYSTVTLGGYGEALLFGNIILLAAIYGVENLESISRKNLLWAGIFGFAAGLGFWANALTMVYTIPALIFILAHLWGKKSKNLSVRWKLLGVGLLGGMIGLFPLWIYIFEQGGFANAIQQFLSHDVLVESGSFVQKVINHLFSVFVFGSTVILGLRPPWEIRWLAVPLAPFAAALAIGGGVFLFRKLKERGEGKKYYQLIGGVMGFLLVCFTILPYGLDPTGRYFLPIVVLLYVLMAGMICSLPGKKFFQWIAVLVILAFNVWGTIQCVLRNPPGLTTQFDAITVMDQEDFQKVITFLQKNDIDRGYSNYWIAYPMAFWTREEIIFSPELPYHENLDYSSKDVRYSLYQTIVAESEQPAYIIHRHPELEQVLTHGFESLGIEWKEEKIGEFMIYYQLSRKVTPLELGVYSK